MSDDPFPDRDMSQADKIAWVVENQGWCAEPVEAVEDPPHPPYTYTIGFESSFQRPEAVIFGLRPVAARGLLGLLADQYAAGLELPTGSFVGLLDNDLPAALLPVDLATWGELFGGAATWYGPDAEFRMWQFLWPDRSGRLPWDDGFEERLRLAQPVIGAVA
jgi:hypothetical protein